jgi:biopolymer transport protein ExbD
VKPSAVRAARGGSPLPALAGLEGLSIRQSIDTSPLAGLILVLLITFMVITPAIGGPYLPRAYTAAIIREELPVVGIDEGGRFYVADHPVPDAELPGAIANALRQTPGTDLVMLTADRDVSFDRVEEVLRQLRSAGVNRVVLEAYLPGGARVTF